MTATEKSVAALRAHAQQRAADTAIETALTSLRKEGKQVNVQTVARRANVTRATIYRHPSLRDRIIAHRNRVHPRGAQPTPPETNHRNDSITTALRMQITKRDTKIEEQRTEIARATESHRNAARGT